MLTAKADFSGLTVLLQDLQIGALKKVFPRRMKTAPYSILVMVVSGEMSTVVQVRFGIFHDIIYASTLRYHLPVTL